MDAASRREFLAAGAAIALPVPGSLTADSTATRTGLLAGKTAVIYGAAGAMGSTVSRSFAREGARVILAGRTLDKVEALAREIGAAGGTAHAARVDALDRSAVDRHLAEVIREHGRADISFNLIGISDTQGAPLLEMDVDAFSRPILTAMRTHYLTATAAARQMATRGGGVILALTAQVARKPYAASGGFGVACAAIEGLWRQLAVELGPAGVRLVVLRSSGSPDAPGVAEAIAQHARTAGVSREIFEARIAEKTMLRRMPRMSEIADAAVLVASNRASAITAAVTNVTCGELSD
jgi:NAD(P)-dependent dehydrogenase (short-subunit alcohol dehydrogenase family)